MNRRELALAPCVPPFVAFLSEPPITPEHASYHHAVFIYRRCLCGAGGRGFLPVEGGPPRLRTPQIPHEGPKSCPRGQIIFLVFNPLLSRSGAIAAAAAAVIAADTNTSATNAAAAAAAAAASNALCFWTGAGERRLLGGG